jgi:hypothetical protein
MTRSGSTPGGVPVETPRPLAALVADAADALAALQLQVAREADASPYGGQRRKLMGRAAERLAAAVDAAQQAAAAVAAAPPWVSPAAALPTAYEEVAP